MFIIYIGDADFVKRYFKNQINHSLKYKTFTEGMDGWNYRGRGVCTVQKQLWVQYIQESSFIRKKRITYNTSEIKTLTESSLQKLV